MASLIDASISCSSSSTTERSLYHEHMIRVKHGGLEMDSFGPKLKHPEEEEANSTKHVISPEMPGEDGVFLTWEDLWVTVQINPSRAHRICPTWRRLGHNGSVRFQQIHSSRCFGRATRSKYKAIWKCACQWSKQALAFETSAYVTQDNILMTTLTVGEAVYYSAQLQLPDMISRLEKKERADMTIREMDEPTSGLDSAASYHVMNKIVNLAQQDGKTVITSIHQPSTEVFELFHNLCLLFYGKTVYFGSASAANEFFALNGFPCPTLRNLSDHYLRMINKDFDEYHQNIEQGFGGKIKTADETIDVLIQSYKLSDSYLQVQKQLAVLGEKEGASLEKKGSQASFLTHSLVLTGRSFVNMYRDPGYYWLRFAINITLCLCLGTVFYNVGATFASIQAMGSMLMFVASLMTFMSIGGFPSFVEDMKIFEHERLNGRYGVAAFVICYWQHTVFHALLASELFYSWGIGLLSCWPSTRI
ncbi:hypothetical protein NE237_029180 [Protea cynaroides]|uniref:Uncharacterized protein n=1 Tax=Protea cynaroides TaxID=273540 RepID=A0A9Q0GRC7_9MAGN|nr:hypothetical protein NE237_029180 [Protea cynaroides]